jgi:hypothetical protein
MKDNWSDYFYGVRRALSELKTFWKCITHSGQLYRRYSATETRLKNGSEK